MPEVASIVARTRKDGTKTYRIGYRDGGKMCWTATIETAEGAAEMLALVERLGPEAANAIYRRRQGRADPSVPLLRDWLATHLEAVAASATPGTVAEYRRMAARTWLPSLGPLPLDVIDRAAVVRWVAWQRQQITARGNPYSPKSIANAHGLLSAALAAAVDRELIPRNVAHKVPLPSDAEREEMVILTEAEWVRLHAAIPPRWQGLVATLYGTGLRWGEVTALRASDLDLDADTPVLRVSRAWKKGAQGVYLGAPKTRRGRRTVSLPTELVPILRALADACPTPDALLFTSAQGRRVQHQHFHGRVWTPALRRSGIGKTPRLHDLRHTHASWCLAHRMDMLTLQYRLGHESLKVTGDTYGHLMPDAHARSAALVSGMLAGSYPQLDPPQVVVAPTATTGPGRTKPPPPARP